MKLTKIEMENFRCYKDRQVLEFDTNGKITLVYGLSGHGKSTLMQFINWMFYNIPPKSKKTEANKPLYNVVKYEETDIGKRITVFGSIDFVHNAIEYSLIKKIVYVKELIYPRIESSEFILNYKAENGSWIPYSGDVNAKINEIVPKALSTYFFFSGEENVIEETSSDLKRAIYNMFGLTKYENAIKHLGDKTDKKSVIYHYHKLRNESKPIAISGTATELLSKAVKYREAFAKEQKNYDAYVARIKKLDERITELTKEIAVNSVDPTKRTNELNSRKKVIEVCEKLILDDKEKISKLLYKCVPYLILSDKAKYTRKVMLDSAKEKKTFKGLMKMTLEDIKEQGTCVCGRCIGPEQIKHINYILDSMPPNSFDYTLSEFIRNTDISNENAKELYSQFDTILSEITSNKIQITDEEKEINNIIEELKNSDSEALKTKAKEIEKLREFKKNDEKNAQESYRKYTNWQAYAKKYTNEYTQVSEYETTKGVLEDKIFVLEKVKKSIEARFNKRKEDTITELEKSIREVYELLSTRKEDFSTNKKFLNADFTLRQEYKAGGQEIIDVYSYIIGMIKAMKQDDEESDSEFPVVIDAPFSKTDHIQVEHVIDVMPNIVSQTAMFTFDIDKIREHADLSKFGKVWFIESDENQEVSKIVKGDLSNVV